MTRRLAPLLLGLVLACCAWASPAAAISCVGAGDVTGLTDCGLGPLTYSGFAVSAQGAVGGGAVFISGAPFTSTDGISQNILGLQVSNPVGAVAGLGDILLTYKTSSTDPTLLNLGVNLGNGGTNVTVNEQVCGSAFVQSTCAGGLLANLTAQPGQLVTANFASPVAGDLFYKKDILFSGSPTNLAFLSDLSNSNEFFSNPGGGETPPPTATPEPATLLLFGSTLTGLGFMARRWQRRG